MPSRLTGLARQPDLPGRDVADVEQVGDDLRLRARVPLDDLEAAREHVGARRAPQHLRPPEDGVERRAQLVGERGDELVALAHRVLDLRARRALRREQRVARLGEPALLVDVGAGAEPARDLAAVAPDGQRAPHEPAIRAVAAAPHAVLDVVRLAGRERSLPGGRRSAIEVVGVDVELPVPALVRRARHARCTRTSARCSSRCSRRAARSRRSAASCRRSRGTARGCRAAPVRCASAR